VSAASGLVVQALDRVPPGAPRWGLGPRASGQPSGL